MIARWRVNTGLAGFYSQRSLTRTQVDRVLPRMDERRLGTRLRSGTVLAEDAIDPSPSQTDNRRGHPESYCLWIAFCEQTSQRAHATPNDAHADVSAFCLRTAEP